MWSPFPRCCSCLKAHHCNSLMAEVKMLLPVTSLFFYLYKKNIEKQFISKTSSVETFHVTRLACQVHIDAGLPRLSRANK